MKGSLSHFSPQAFGMTDATPIPSDWFGDSHIRVYKKGGDACRGFWKERLVLPRRGWYDQSC